MQTQAGASSGWPGLAHTSCLPPEPHAPTAESPCALCGKALESGCQSEKKGKQRGQAVIGNDCPDIPFQRVHALNDTSGNFFQQQAFSPPLVDMLKAHTYVFNEVTDSPGKPAAAAGGSQEPGGRFHLLASHWESSLSKVKSPVRKNNFFFLEEREQEQKEKLHGLRQLLLFLKTKKEAGGASPHG